MSSHVEINNDSDHYVGTSRSISEMELGIINTGEDSEDDINIEIKHYDPPNTNDDRKQQQGSTSITGSDGPILEVMKSQQQHPNKSPPSMTIRKIESVNELSEDEDETDINNARIILRPGAERVYPTGVPPSTTHIDDNTTNLMPSSPGTSSRITSEQQEQQPMEIIATLVTDDSPSMPLNNSNGSLVIAVAEEKKCCEIHMDCSKYPKTVTFVGLMFSIALVVIAVAFLMNKPGNDDAPSDLIDNDMDNTPRPPSSLPTMTPTISPTSTPSTFSPTPAPGQIVPLGDPIYGQGVNYHTGYVISLSDNGQRVAMGSLYGSARGMIQVYEWITDNVWTPMGSPIMQTQMSYSLKGSISLSANGDVLAIDAHNPTTPFTVTYHYVNGDWQPMGQRQMKARAVSLSSDGLHLAIADENYHARVFSFDENDNDWILKGSVVEGRSVMVSLSGDGKRLVVSDYENDIKRGEVRVFKLPTMVTVGQDNNVDIPEIATETKADELQPLGDTITAKDRNNYLGWEISTSYDGSIIAIGTRAGNYARIIQYNPSTNRWITIDTIYGNAMDSNTFGFSISLSASGRRLAIGVMGYNDAMGRGAVYEWDERMKSYEQVGDDIVGDEVQQFETNSISISRDGGYVAVGAPYANDQEGVTKTGRVRVFKI